MLDPAVVTKTWPCVLKGGRVLPRREGTGGPGSFSDGTSVVASQGLAGKSRHGQGC